eukprot:GEMP01007703.1.p1 GENE.GEMP01007703.1~~GEMP01007703.1.p1  ORF type:complete len:625 (+),score=171.58 GEMP01007703.1:38-1876(+)
MSDDAPPRQVLTRRYGTGRIRPGYAESGYGGPRSVHRTPSFTRPPGRNHTYNCLPPPYREAVRSQRLTPVPRPTYPQFPLPSFSQYVKRPPLFASPSSECEPSHASSNSHAWTPSTDVASTLDGKPSSSDGSHPSTPRVPSTDVASTAGDIDSALSETTPLTSLEASVIEKEDADNWDDFLVLGGDHGTPRRRVKNTAAREAARRGSWARIESTDPQQHAAPSEMIRQMAARRPPLHPPPLFHDYHARPSISPTTPQACGPPLRPTTPQAVQRTSQVDRNLGDEQNGPPRLVRPRIPVPIATAVRTQKSARWSVKFSASDQCTGGVLLRPETYLHDVAEQPLAGCSRVAVCGMFHSGNHPTRDYALLFDDDAQPRRRTRKHRWESDVEFPIGPVSPCGTPVEQWGAWKHRVPDRDWNVPRNVAVLCCVRDPLFFVPRLAQEPYSVEPAAPLEFKVKKGEKTKIDDGGRYLFEPIAIRPQWNSKYDSAAEWDFDNVAHLWRAYVHGFLTGQMCSSDEEDRQRFFLVKLEDVQKRPKEIIEELVRLGLRLIEPHKPFAALDKPAKKGCDERSKLIENNAQDKRWISWENCPELVDILREEIDPELLEVLDYAPI